MSRTALSLLALLGLAALTAICAAIYGPRIEQQLTGAAIAQLESYGLDGAVTVRMDGRDAYVTADDPEIAERAAAIVARVRGIREASTVSRTGPAPPLADSLSGPFALRPLSQGGVALYGTVPSDIVRERLMAAALQAFPGVPVRDGLSVDSTADGSWAEDAATAMLQLRLLADPGLSVTPDGAFEITGRVDTDAMRLNTITRMAESVEPREVIDNLAVASVPIDEADSVAGDQPEVAQADPEGPPRTSGDEAPDEEADDESGDETPDEQPDDTPAPRPSGPGSRVEVEDGIGDAGLARALRQRLGSAVVSFETGTDRLTSGSADALRRAASVLKANPNVVIELQGHADPSERNAFDLSARRARAAKRVLTEAGVPFEQIEAAAYADSTPLDRDRSPAAQARNRRVVIKLLRRR